MLASRSRVAARLRISLAALLLAAAPLGAVSQITAPRLVDETAEEDEPLVADELPPPPRPDPVAPPATSPAPPAPAAAQEPSPAAADAAPSDAAPGAATAPAPPAGEPPLAAAAAGARPIEPVTVAWPDLLARWAERRDALREGDPVRAGAAEQALLAARRALAIQNLTALSAVEVREVHRALDANLTLDAVARARTAVALAPDHPDAHVALARALLAASPGSPGEALAALRDALAAALREPHALRAFYGDLLAAGFAAVFTAAVAVVLLLLVRRLRTFLHDFHHLPLLRGTAPIQTGFLALVLLAAPVAFGLGPFATLAVAALAIWLYLGLAERVVVTVALAALLALPWAAGEAARVTAWTGTLAETVHALEHGAVPDEEAAALVASADAAGPGAPAPLLAALGRHAKRRGDLALAERLYGAAAAADPRAAALDVNLGNVHFLRGDLDRARAAYLAAQDRAAGDLVVLGVAHYNLSKVYLRTSHMEQSTRNREKAESEAGDFLRAHGSDDDFSANWYLVDVPVAPARIAALASADGSAAALTGWVRGRLLGTLPAAAWPWGGAAFLVGLWALGLASRALAPSRPCARCGGPSCRRCDPAAGEECGQCLNVFARRAAVDARDRLRKEAQVRRHARLTRAVTRVLAVVGGGAGQVFHGAVVRGAAALLAVLFLGFVIWFWRGIVPPPQPSPYVLVGKLAVAAPLAILVWALAVRDAFRRTRGS